MDLAADERARRLEAVRAESLGMHEELVELLDDEVGIGDVGVDDADQDGAPSSTPAPAQRPLGDIEAALDDLAERPKVLLAAKGTGGDEHFSPEKDRIPERIGPYRVIRLLGEGGMGRVFEAEQTEPLVRRVAVKVLRHDAGQGVLTRFDAERRALAVMDHPNIARMLDAGATEDGKPWFAMELVDGVSVTEWARQRGLDLDERIKLILPVCDAVQHAHLKGVIHRDLKPSNILVTEDDDGGAMPKVIDFGIAKAIEQPLLARTLATRFGELVGTPEYMSPEQASLGSVDVDTRSDVYALGLVLYELLVGELPLSAEQLRGLAFDEICRRIREDETPRPSHLVATRERRAGADPRVEQKSQTGDAATRSTRAWTRRLRRDLDAVLLKALAKDRNRRYESAASFAGDLRRFLRDEAVEAAAPSWRYLAGKFIRRHRSAVTLGGLAVLSLLAGLALAIAGLLQAREAERRATEQARIAEQATEFMVGLFEVSDPKWSTESEEPSARELLDRAAESIGGDLDESPQVRARLLGALAQVYANLGLDARTVEMRRRQLEVLAEIDESPAVLAITRSQLATALRGSGDIDGAQAEASGAFAELEAAGLGDSLAAGRVLDALASAHWARSEYATARDYLQRSLELRIRHPDPDEGWRMRVLNNLAIMESELDLVDEARAHYLEALSLSEELWGQDDAWRAKTLNNLGNLELRHDRLEEAARHHREALDIRLRLLGEDHPGTSESLNNLGGTLMRQGEYAEAAGILERAVQSNTRREGAEHPRTLSSRFNLANTLRQAGDLTGAEHEFKELLPLFRKTFGESHSAIAHLYIGLAEAEQDAGRLDAAESWARKGLEVRRQIYGDDHRLTEEAREILDRVESIEN